MKITTQMEFTNEELWYLKKDLLYAVQELKSIQNKDNPNVAERLLDFIMKLP